MEAKQKVLITSKDGQTATGDWATFDIKANTVLMGDHVMVSRGKDVAQGPRLKIDLTTGMYRFELEQEPAGGASRPGDAAPPAAAHGSIGSGRNSDRARMSARQAVPAVLSRKTRKNKAKDAVKKIAARDGRQAERGLAARPPSASPAHAGRLTPCGCSRSRQAKKPPRSCPAQQRPRQQMRDGHAARDEPSELYGGQGWLTAVNVQKSYRSRMVVKGVSLATGRGEAVGLLGPNGAGKTTVFYMITGLVPADAGHITLDGRDVTRLPMYRRARLGIGYLPQEASIFRGLTVEQNIMAVLELVEPNRKRSARSSSTACSKSSTSRGCGNRRRWRSRAASGGAARSPAPWPPGPRSCCWTSPSPASTPWPSATSSSWCGNSPHAASAC